MITLATIISVLSSGALGGILTRLFTSQYSLHRGPSLIWGLFGGILYLMTLAPADWQYQLSLPDFLLCILVGFTSGLALAFIAGFIKTTA